MRTREQLKTIAKLTVTDDGDVQVPITKRELSDLIGRIEDFKSLLVIGILAASFSTFIFTTGLVHVTGHWQP